MRALFTAAILVACGISASATGVEARPDLVAKVKAGELTEAKASWWGYDSVDATDALQSAIRSGVSELIVDNPGTPWVVRPIFLESNQTIRFEKGVVIEAKRGAFKEGGDCLMSVILKHNVILRGSGAVLRMHRADYDNDALYKKAEWRHVLSIRSSRRVEVHGLTLALSGGDGIYLGVSKRGVPNENILIKDVVCDRNYRQGISVISARHLLIENTIMKNTEGTPPQAGIDFEPNGSTEELVDCVMRNCISENNKGYGYVLSVSTLHADSKPLSIRLENCISRAGNLIDFYLGTGNSESEAVGGRVEVIHCRFEKARQAAVKIARKPAAGAFVRFENCVIDNPSMTPIVLQAGTGCLRAVGGVDFGTLEIFDPKERLPMRYEDWIGAATLEKVKGTLVVHRNGKTTTMALTEAWLDRTFPAREYKKIPPLSLDGMTFAPANLQALSIDIPNRTFFLRKRGVLVLYAKSGDRVSLTIDYKQVGKYSGRPLVVTAVSPSGKRIAAGKVPFRSVGEIAFTAPETGVYRLPIDAGANKAGIVRSSHPPAISGKRRPIRFIGPAGDFYFLIPAGTKEAGVLVYGEGSGEAIKAEVFDVSGKKVWGKDNITLPQMWSPEQPPPPRDQVWRLRLSRASAIACEDNYIDLRGIPPFLARNPRALLKPKR